MEDLADLVDSTGNGILDTVLHYGLFLGAIFQLVCIFAVIFVPSKGDEEKEEIEELAETSGGRLQTSSSAGIVSSKRKHEKKKRR